MLVGWWCHFWRFYQKRLFASGWQEYLVTYVLRDVALLAPWIKNHSRSHPSSGIHILISDWAVCSKIERGDPMCKVLACAGGCLWFVAFPLFTLVWRVSNVGGLISHKLTWCLPEHLEQVIFDRESLTRWLFLRQIKHWHCFLRHSFLVLLLVAMWQLAGGCCCLQNIQCVAFEGWFSTTNPAALDGSSFQLFLRSSRLYVFSFAPRAFTPSHLSLFFTIFHGSFFLIVIHALLTILTLLTTLTLINCDLDY